MRLTRSFSERACNLDQGLNVSRQYSSTSIRLLCWRENLILLSVCHVSRNLVPAALEARPMKGQGAEKDTSKGKMRRCSMWPRVLSGEEAVVLLLVQSNGCIRHLNWELRLCSCVVNLFQLVAFEGGGHY